MKVKKLLKLFILITILIMLAILTGCGKKEEQKTENNTVGKTETEVSAFESEYGEYKPDLWMLENKETGSKIYLFGSIHIGIEEMYPLPDTVVNAFNESDILCVETDVTKIENNMFIAMELMNYITYTDGTVLKDHLPKEKLEKLKELGEKYGFSVEEELPYKPILYEQVISQTMMEETKYDSTLGVDRHFITEAKAKGMEVKDIEDYRTVYQLLGGLSDDVNEYVVDSLIESDENKETMFEETDGLFKSWVNGKVEEYIIEVSKKHTIEMVKYMRETIEYDNAILGIRNVTMVSKIEEYLKTGDTYFYVVGAAHYPGEMGILNHLKVKGYNVEEVKY